jgi:hypothetical protein
MDHGWPRHAAYHAARGGNLAHAARSHNLWTAAGYLGMTVEVPERTYGDHHPDYLTEAVEGITAKKPARNAAA